ncbi:aminotransferase class I/II-fold pyridoxal phosphate-dependent enzyme [Phycicoccus sp. CSK15P-2]|uniref:trans-sulfuration enzyme family protein n=1 Tax=Phycicoccus sp. CSK15P-2 TaxID=2807627 RepID=UPI001952728D|nr:aminotransferase class I/II-fold pyridoxal phosphate-dependent enzyme [Phycicoccus sp. CSK15P-2]MBM6404797.1 aminotransferase class I/II-fold pyridoxal phosphate-dependent enzyme [Phycicoccus sp. CSK15P-2]
MTDEPRPPRPDLTPATRLVALGREPVVPGGQVGAPLVLTSTYHADGPVSYARSGNPTWSAFEEALGSLEGGEALVLASGMAAVAAVFSLLPHGGTVVVPDAAYNGVMATVSALEADTAATVRRVDVTDTGAVVAALEGADLLWLESPTNPLLEVADLEALTAAARERGVLTAVDNTFSTPLLQRPLELGADVVVHSATKYLSGHSDLLLGALVTPATADGRALHERLRRHRQLHGGVAGPMETWLALRGLRTLHLRLERACANAAALAERLADHPAVTRVRYPGIGAIVSVEVLGGPAGAERVCAATEVWVHATSLGGVESLLERRRRHPDEPATVPEDLLRLAVGVEDVEDLWRDLSAALDRAAD